MTLHYLVALPIAFGLLARTPAAAGAQEVSVVVTPSAVRVTVPVDSSPFWWNSPTTPPEVLEYEWRVAVTNGERRYAFGFSLFKHAQARPQTGELGALLRAGQASVWQLTDSGGTVLAGWDIALTAQPHALEILVRGSDAVKTLFGALPPTVSVQRLVAGIRHQNQPASVEYQTR